MTMKPLSFLAGLGRLGGAVALVVLAGMSLRPAFAQDVDLAGLIWQACQPEVEGGASACRPWQTEAVETVVLCDDILTDPDMDALILLASKVFRIPSGTAFNAKCIGPLHRLVVPPATAASDPLPDPVPDPAPGG